MDSGITGKIATNVKFTGQLTISDDTEILVNGCTLQAMKENGVLKVTYNGLQYRLVDIDGHLVLNRVQE